MHPGTHCIFRSSTVQKLLLKALPACSIPKVRDLWMSIVPIFAMAFGIAKGFGFERYLEQQLTTQFKGQEEVINKVIVFANSLLARTGGGLIAGIGVVLLFWSVINVLSSIEHAFNDIWQVEKPRSWVRRFPKIVIFELLSIDVASTIKE